MARTEAKLTTCMVTQDLNPDHFQWPEEYLNYIKKGDISAICEHVINLCEEHGIKVLECRGIIHDKDEHTVWDEGLKIALKEPKLLHFHVVMKFDAYTAVTLAILASVLGIAPQYIEKPQKGRFAYDNMLAYLIHAKDEDKYPYSPESVYTARGESYMQIYTERVETWNQGRLKKKTQTIKASIETVEEQILLGQLTMNQVLLTDSLYYIYAQYKRRIDDAFETFAQRKIAKTIQAMENGEFKISVFYITGVPGSGKSYFTDHWANYIREAVKQLTGETWQICKVASSNPFDEYKGEEIMIMDDLRGMSLSASDWLKLLDPDRINTGSARYRNKIIASRVIIINSERDVLDFFYHLKGASSNSVSEAMDQFFRRILARVTIVKAPDELRTVNISEPRETKFTYSLRPRGVYDSVDLHYDFIGNKKENMTTDEAMDYLTKMVAKRNNIEYEDKQMSIDDLAQPSEEE